MYIIIVNTKEHWGHYTLITDEDGYPAEYPSFEDAETWFIDSRFSDFPVRFVNMELLDE